jgi:hypothetical protein
MVANDDLDDTVAVACFDLDRNRARLPRMQHCVVERLGRGDQDVEDVVLGGVLPRQPEPKLGAKQKCLSRPGPQPQTEARVLVVWGVAVCAHADSSSSA